MRKSEFTQEELYGFYAIQKIGTNEFFHKENGFTSSIYVYPRWRALDLTQELRNRLDCNVEAKSVAELKEEDRYRKINRPIYVCEALDYRPRVRETNPHGKVAEQVSEEGLAIKRAMMDHARNERWRQYRERQKCEKLEK